MNTNLDFYVNLIIISISIYFIYNLLKSNKIVEGFSYNTCINKGFSKEFCVQTPTSQFGPNTCLCDNGTIGYKMVGYGGECVCNMPNFRPIYTPVYSPQSAAALF